MDVDLQVVQGMDRLNLKLCLGPDPLRVCGCLSIVQDMDRMNVKLCLGPDNLMVCGRLPRSPGEALPGAKHSEGLGM